MEAEHLKPWSHRLVFDVGIEEEALIATPRPYLIFELVSEVVRSAEST